MTVPQLDITTPDHNFDKKLLTLILCIVLICLMAICFSPVTDQLAQATMVTVLTGALTTVLGGIIALTAGRNTGQRSTDPKDQTKETI